MAALWDRVDAAVLSHRRFCWALLGLAACGIMFCVMELQAVEEASFFFGRLALKVTINDGQDGS